MRRFAITLLAVAGLAGPATARAAVAAPVTARTAVASHAAVAPHAAVAAPAAIPRGVVRVLAPVPAPGDPALPFVADGEIFEGTYTAATGSSAPSKIFAFSQSGALLKSWTMSGQPLSTSHGVQVANADAAGDLLVLDDTTGRVLLMNPTSGAMKLYATIPDIPLCSDAGASAECSQALTEETPEPDYAAWGPDGSLYVTDYQQAVIWRIPPHGGTPSIWLGGPALDGELFGTAGIWMEPDHRTLLIDQASNLGGSGDGLTGKLYSVPIEPDGAPGPLKLLWTSNVGALPDGFAVAQSGDIYMAQIGPSANDVVELSPAGKPITTFGSLGTGANGSSIPFDEPSGVAYDGSNLIIANQSYLLGDSAHMALLDLGTGEQGQPVYIPRTAGPAVPKRKAKPKPKAKAKRKLKKKKRR